MIKGPIVLTTEQIFSGKSRIGQALRAANFGANDIAYTPTTVDRLGETQGGWFVDFDKKTRDKLKAAALGWSFTGACSGDNVDDCIAAIKRTSDEYKKAVQAKGPNALQRKATQALPKQVVIQMEQGAGKMHQTAPRKYDYIKNERDGKLLASALKKLKGLGHLTDEEIYVATEYYAHLEAFARLDPALASNIPYIVQNLTQLQQWASARSR